MTKKYERIWLIFTALSVLANVFPIAWFTIQALSDSTLAYQKVSLCMTVLIVLILTIYNLISKVAMRCRIWIILIGIYIALGEFLPALIIITVCQCLDELVFSNVAKYYHQKFQINKEMDKRGV